MKSILLGFTLFWLALSCSEKIMDNPTAQEQNKVPKLKSASINYYVSNSGSDSNPGTSSAPFASLQKAADTANPGDTIVVRDGVYSTSDPNWLVWMKKSGTPDAYITFKSEHKWGAKLDGGNMTNACFIFYNVPNYVSYIRIIDFDIRNFQGGGISCTNDYSNYIFIQGNKIHDFAVNTSMSLKFPQGVFVNPNNHHWTIDKNLIYNIGGVIPDTYYLNKAHAVYTGTPNDAASAPHHITITNNIIFGISGCALNLSSNNDLIANNTIAWSNENSQGGNNFVTMVGPGFYNETIINNVFYQPPSRAAYAILNYGACVGWTVKNNIVYGGNLWFYHNSDNTSAMGGNNYGPDCEKPEVDPKFISAIRTNSPNVDFSLQSTSPAINAGASIGLTSDFYNKLINGMPDIGAIEYGGVASTPTPTQTVYYNTQVSTTAVKNDCGSGYTGSTVTYTVLAKKYSSTISQADADSKAQADLTANAQSYANSNGTCTAITVYYNTAVSTTAVKNDCGTGYTGSTVTYTVVAKKYSSTVSQADADSKAQSDLNANAQSYANSNGTCTAVALYYNTAMSTTAVKNDCGTGYQGSTVTYTIPAGKYNSSISQADADLKASNDLSANAQDYANTNGTCERIKWWTRDTKKWWGK